jgi:hypothetical protein
MLKNTLSQLGYGMSVTDRVRTNVKDRVESVKIIPSSARETARASLDYLKRLEPVQALCVAAEGAGNGIFRFVKKQAEITRRWVP